MTKEKIISRRKRIYLWLGKKFNIVIEPIFTYGRQNNDRMHTNCAFIVKGKKYKYLFFLHPDDRQPYKGSERIRSFRYSLLQFHKNELKNMWWF